MYDVYTYEKRIHSGVHIPVLVEDQFVIKIVCSVNVPERLSVDLKKHTFSGNNL